MSLDRSDMFEKSDFRDAMKPLETESRFKAYEGGRAGRGGAATLQARTSRATVHGTVVSTEPGRMYARRARAHVRTAELSGATQTTNEDMLNVIMI